MEMVRTNEAVTVLSPSLGDTKNLFTGFIANLKGGRREDWLGGTDLL